MKTFGVALLFAAGLGAGPALAQPGGPGEGRLFELREYHVAAGRGEELHARFRTHTLPLHEKHGITNVAYLVPPGSDDRLYVILAYPDAASRKRSWEAFVADPEWQRVRRATDAHGRLVEKIREHPLTPTADCPPVAAPAAAGWAFEVQTVPARTPLLPHADGADRKLVGSWTMPAAGPADAEATLVRLVARRPPAPVAVPRVAFFHDPSATVFSLPSRTAAAPEPSADGVRSLLVLPTDYSPMK